MSKQEVIEREGQRYYDEPIFITVSNARRLSVAVAAALGSPLPRDIETLSHHERVRLRWMKPDGRGGLIARTF